MGKRCPRNTVKRGQSRQRRKLGGNDDGLVLL